MDRESTEIEENNYHVCDNSECENQRMQMIKELTMARYRIRELERVNRRHSSIKPLENKFSND